MGNLVHLIRTFFYFFLVGWAISWPAFLWPSQKQCTALKSYFSCFEGYFKSMSMNKMWPQFAGLVSQMT